MNEHTDVGFLGLGQMGSAIAERLLGQSLRLHVYDPAASVMERFRSLGAVTHASPREVADHASVVFACLPNVQVSRQVALGDDGVAHGSAIQVYAEMSTIGREAIEDLAEQLAGHGIQMLDSPVTGGAPVARAGQLTLLVSGPDAVVADVRPLLQMMGRNVFVLGDKPGMGQIMKVVNNIIMGANVVVASEGMSLGAKAGLNPTVMCQALQAGTAQSFAAGTILPRALAGTFDYGASLTILDKDMALGLQEALALQASLPVITQARDQWHAAYEAGLGDLDFTTILQYVEQQNGTLVRDRKG
ncbi:NAD(P)-dependent oxidoreductase [Pseudorhodoferax sp.]|uniref:NAD(P)-dependent oxidoreductase n=1 Tax=Pseudorhodoferax sp. TaxID=1993553 RepID=UPI0039E63967